MSAAPRIIDRLDGVRQTAPSRWIARCPAHEDRSPSLSVRELDDGRVLIHDFGGCETRDVLFAIGLGFIDLFDKQLAHHFPPVRGGLSARELLRVISHETTVAALLVTEAQSRPLTGEERERLANAASRLAKAEALSHGR
jgi:hypothetical protein